MGTTTLCDPGGAKSKLPVLWPFQTVLAMAQYMKDHEAE